MPGSFFGTSVLLYLASSDDAKADRAEGLLAGGGAVSVQVLNEIANVAQRKMRLSWSETHAFLDSLRRLLTVYPLTLDVHETGLSLARRHGFSVYDAMVVASALHAGCDTLWSEDMHSGLVVEDAVRIINPFRP